MPTGFNSFFLLNLRSRYNCHEFLFATLFYPGFLTNTAENLFKTIWGMQPRDAADTTAGVLSKEDKVKAVIEDLLYKLPEEFNIQDLMSKVNVRLFIRYPDHCY